MGINAVELRRSHPIQHVSAAHGALLLGTVQTVLAGCLPGFLPSSFTFKYRDTLFIFRRCELTLLMTIQNTIQNFPLPYDSTFIYRRFLSYRVSFLYFKRGVPAIAHQGPSPSERGSYRKHQAHKPPEELNRV